MEMNEINLRRLADYLMTLPEDYEKFEMMVFHEQGDITYNYEIPKGVINSCGTAACAVGHAPCLAHTYTEFDPKHDSTWWAYSERVFGLDTESMYWEWCFDSGWSDIDNTPQGAAKRIYLLLEHPNEVDYFIQEYEYEKYDTINFCTSDNPDLPDHYAGLIHLWDSSR